MKQKKNSIVITDFSGIYEKETFYQKLPYIWIDCKDIPGTYGYCDEEASKELASRLETIPVEGIHFIDSGNYHYMSKLWTDKITIPFSLVVFDHHTDMQPSLFANILSCGCWVKTVLDKNPNIVKVILVGADSTLLDKIGKEYKDRIHIYSQTDLMHKEGWQKFSEEYLKEPIYISIDKDILNASCVETDWDQGIFTMEELKLLLKIIVMKETVIGVDICGECSNQLTRYSRICEQIKRNDTANSILLKFMTEQALKQQNKQ